MPSQYNMPQRPSGVLPENWNQIQQKMYPFLQYGNALNNLPDMDMINRLFDTSAGNLGSRMATERGRAQNTAGAIAGSRGYANPGSFITGAGSQAAAPYVQALGGIEEGRARAQTQLPYQNLQALLPFLQMMMQQNQYEDQSKFDWSSIFPTIATLGAYAINPAAGIGASAGQAASGGYFG